ncbi:MAG: hypothetical protein GY774_00315 [Planctomycetes bacterium]|nr:hypothetical protein [Planctomycetota bacterium]
MNNVVIGPLADLIGYDDCLRFNGSTSLAHANSVSLSGDFFAEWTGKVLSARVGTNAIFSNGGAFAGGVRFSVYYNGNNVVVQLDNDVVLVARTLSVSDIFEVNTVTIRRVSGSITMIVRNLAGGILAQDAFVCAYDITTTQPLSIGAWFNVVSSLFQDFSNIITESFKIGVSESELLTSYIQNGDYGAPTLEDHSGNGNDAALVDNLWWKSKDGVPVGENFPDKESYKATWALPMAEDQDVVGVIGQDLPPAEDSFWDGYNDSPTYTLTVTQQKLVVTDQSANYSYSFGY